MVWTISRLAPLSSDGASAVHNAAGASLSFRFTILIAERLTCSSHLQSTVVLLARRVELPSQLEQLVCQTESGEPQEL